VASYLDIKIRDLWAGILTNIFIFAFFFFSLFGFSESVLATHEADHRYLVSGYVRDGVGVAIEDATVHLEHKGGEKKKVNTNGSGYYEILFHLHNDNLGDEIIVRYKDVEKKIKVFFDTEDAVSTRSDAVDFGADAKETEDWVYLTSVSFFLVFVAFYIAVKKMKKKKKAITRKEKRSRKQK